MFKWLFCLFLSTTLSFAIGEFRVEYRECLIRLAWNPKDSPVTPVDVGFFEYKGYRYQLPTQILPVAKELANSLVPPLRKIEYLSMLRDIFDADRPYQGIVEAGLSVNFNRAMKNAMAGSVDSATEISIVIHQQNELQDATAAFLKSETVLRDVPVITLASGLFKILSNNLLKTSSQIRLSNLGEVSELPIMATTFNLFGGYCSACMTRTITGIAHEKIKKESTEPLNFFVYSSLSYTQAEHSSPSLANELAFANIHQFEESLNLNSIRESVPGRSTLSRPKYLETTHGPAYEIEIHWEGYPQPLRIYVVAK